MNKEEVLRKAQKENSDEMELQIRDKSIKWTYCTMIIAAAIFSFLRDMQGYPIMDLTATVSISVAVGHIYKFIKCKETLNVWIGILMLVVFVISTIRFMMGH
ncbi:MAG: hypothetical protein HFF01_05785 [Erysipelotrichaceae bacterium]|nr:hypothetical protein [Erysipelotrichaceae bacterium]MCI9524551.1 hypothetical protein [Erysipelotrichaceae bacterium]